MPYKRWQGSDSPVADSATVAHLRLEADNDAPGRARAALAQVAGGVSEDVLERATLLISEAVSNAVQHAGGREVRLAIWPAAGAVTAVVADDGPGFIPIAQPTTVAEGDGGFGLPLLDTLSEAWGSGFDGEASVWFEVAPRIITRPERPALTHSRNERAHRGLELVGETGQAESTGAADRDGLDRLANAVLALRRRSRILQPRRRRKLAVEVARMRGRSADE